MFDGLQLSKLDWQALTTLVAGILAVGAAMLIGFRQLAITKKQIEISGKQNDLTELALRQQLFERRMIVYEAVASLLGEIIRDAAYPNRSVEVGFINAMGSSRFLFPPATHQGVQEVWKEASDFRVLKLRMETAFAANGRHAQQDLDSEERALQWFLERLTDLPNLFGNSIRLA